MELYLHYPNTPSWRGTQLKKEAQGQLYIHLSVRHGLIIVTEKEHGILSQYSWFRAWFQTGYLRKAGIWRKLYSEEGYVEHIDKR
jgi:hypothetical protein